MAITFSVGLHLNYGDGATQHIQEYYMGTNRYKVLNVHVTPNNCFTIWVLTQCTGGLPCAKPYRKLVSGVNVQLRSITIAI